MKDQGRKRDFWLVQRMVYDPLEPNADPKKARPETVFGYGRVGDFGLEYMGSAEFEWGALPASWQRFSAGTVVQDKVTFADVEFELMWIDEDPDAKLDFVVWAQKGFPTKEGGYQIASLIDPEAKYPVTEPTIWWDIEGDVLFTLAKFDAFTKFTEGMLRTKYAALRDKPQLVK